MRAQLNPESIALKQSATASFFLSKVARWPVFLRGHRRLSRGKTLPSISSQGKSMEISKFVAVACDSAEGVAGDVSGHFGRTPFFVVAELAGDQVVSSRAVASPGHGEGCGMPNFV